MFVVIAAKETTAWLSGLTFSTVLNMEDNFMGYGPFKDNEAAEGFAKKVRSKAETARVWNMISPEWVQFASP